MKRLVEAEVEHVVGGPGMSFGDDSTIRSTRQDILCALRRQREDGRHCVVELGSVPLADGMRAERKRLPAVCHRCKRLTPLAGGLPVNKSGGEQCMCNESELAAEVTANAATENADWRPYTHAGFPKAWRKAVRTLLVLGRSSNS